MSPLPATGADLTLPLLRDVLGPSVTGVRAEPLAGAPSLWGSLFRLHVHWDGPATVVAKIARTVDDIAWDVLRVHEREVAWFTQLGPRSPIRYPTCYFAAVDGPARRSLLLLEDLGGSAGRSARADGQTLSPRQAESVLRAVAALHATWWQREELTGIDWLARFPLEPGTLLDERVAEHWPRFELLVGAALPAGLLDVVRAAVAAPSRRWSRAAGPPFTLGHGDLHGQNLVFNPAPAFIDWQFASATNPGHDVATLLATSLSTADRRAHQPRLLDAYRDALESSGVVVSGSQLREWLACWAPAMLAPNVNSVGLAESSPSYATALTRTVRRRAAFAQDHAPGWR